MNTNILTSGVNVDTPIPEKNIVTNRNVSNQYQVKRISIVYTGWNDFNFKN